MIIDNVDIRASGFNPGRDELREYVNYVKARQPNVKAIIVTLCENDEVDLAWTSKNFPFERIRRITGYLSGNLDTWNNSKQAEEKDRLKHWRG